MQLLKQTLDWTSTRHDMNFVKHITNMKSTGITNKSKNMGLILI